MCILIHVRHTELKKIGKHTNTDQSFIPANAKHPTISD